jgi:hypothetical protein
MNSDQIIVQIGQVDLNNLKTVKAFGQIATLQYIFIVAQ